MTDPSGRSSPGEINNLLIWQQPHPLIFAEYEYRAFPTLATLEKWEGVVKATADWMVAFAWKNSSSGHYDLGPPMFVVSEDTSPNVTQNPAFELAYWRLGLGIAEEWMRRSRKEVNSTWTEGIESDFWDDPAYTSDHPALVGLHGWLPPTDGLDTAIAKLRLKRLGGVLYAVAMMAAGWDGSGSGTAPGFPADGLSKSL
ncbi:hypothetical protein BD779DRAFT_1544102 [Infundibulicybe gibba]|nr:hypothetical protein BD779DRAFT_1544102 [Infundibulicybe gibba]